MCLTVFIELINHAHGKAAEVVLGSQLQNNWLKPTVEKFGLRA